MLHLIRRRTGGNGPGSPRRSGRSASARSVPTMLTTLLAVLLPLGLAQPALAAPSGRIVVTPPPVGPILTNEYHVESNRSIAWNGSTTVVTATDAFGNLDYWYQPGGATGWTKQVVASASSGTSYYDAEITASPTGVLITAVEYYTGSIDFWWEADGTTTWYQETVASGGQAGYFGNPSIAWSGAGVYIAATDKYGNAELWYAASGTATWTEQVVQRSYDGSYYEYASVAWDGYSSQPVVSADDRTSGNIYAWTPTSSGIWQTQQVQAALTPTDTLSHADITEVAGGMAITYTESVGNLQYLAEGTEASSWSGGTVASWFPDNDAYNDPSMAWTGDGEMIVANDAPTGDLDAWIGDGASGNAFQEQLIAPGPSDGGADYYGEASVAWTGTDEVVVASQTNTGHLAFWWHPTGSSAWYQEIIA
jgi:hypothetical protein